MVVAATAFGAVVAGVLVPRRDAVEIGVAFAAFPKKKEKGKEIRIKIMKCLSGEGSVCV